MRHGPAVEPEGFTGDFMLYLMREVHTRYGSQLYPKFMQEHGITAEEWRVLSMLSDQEGAMAIEDIVPVVLQPVGRLRDLLEWMAEKGYLAFDEEQKVSLTDTGKVLSNDLLTIAKEHEDSVLSRLDEPARRQLKDSLKSVIKQLDNLKQST
jgi:DNA-binding MarR family transcriptional regulator